MKVLIPTNDCLTIAPDFENANSFRLLTISNGVIRDDSYITSAASLRNKYLFGLKELGEIDLISEKQIAGSDIDKINNSDQNIVIASSISAEAENILHSAKYEVFRINEINIINALNVFFRDFVKVESDYCCQP